MSTTRRHFDVTQKAQIVRRHLAGKEPVSTLADEVGLQPSQIHGWIHQVFAQAEKAFERSAANGRAESTKTPASNNWKPNWPRRTKSSRNSWRTTSAKKSEMGR